MMTTQRWKRMLRSINASKEVPNEFALFNATFSNSYH